MATASLDQPVAKTGYKVIDADTHLTEPHDMWTSRAPASIRDRVPQVKMLDGQRCWVIDGDKSIGTGAHPNSAILKDGGKVRVLDDFLKLQFEDVHTGSSSLKERLQVMDETGIYAQIVYPNILGFGGQAAAKVDADLRLACVKIYNDAVAEMQADSNGRFFPMALLPWWDVDLAIKETERCAAMGLRGININSDPHLVDLGGERLPDLAHEHWYPLWEVCEDMGMPINFHIGASETSIDWMGQQGWPSLTRDLRSGISGAMLFFNNGKVVANLIYSGLLDRFRNLKFVSVESGIGWVPFMMEALDYQLVEIAEGRSFEKKPSEYFRSNFYACFWFEQGQAAADMMRKVGIDNVLFETDFPHPTGLYPIDNLETRYGDLTHEEKTKVLGGNAAKLYRIDI
ncbi:MAG: amidohydrolase [Novosphingobium sp.]|nr:amidohydrolase [Novosphingobium sp.]